MTARGNRGPHAAGLALALAFIVVQCLDMTTYPLVVGDEALLNDAGWQLATTGRFRADILALNRGSEDRWLRQVPGLEFAAAAPGAAWLAYALQYPREFQAQYLSLLLDRSGGRGILDGFAAEGARYAMELRRLPTIYAVAFLALCGVIAARLWTDRGARVLLTLAALVVFLHALVAGKLSGF
jgi:hypothetical protein